MRIPHYLSRSRSGIFFFRQRVPADLKPIVGRHFIKHTLHTRELYTARWAALELSSRYARAFDAIRGRRMSDKPTVAEVLANVADQGIKRYELDLNTGQLKVDSPQDHALAMEALREFDRIGVVGARRRQEPDTEQSKVDKVLSMAVARKDWLKSIESSTIAKTYTIKKTAIESLEHFTGSTRPLHTLTRADLAGWYQAMRDAGISDATLPNKQSYIGGKKGFFAWAMASGFYRKGDNPAAGHVSYSANARRKRKKFAFKAFSDEEVSAIFAPASFSKLSMNVRWACVIGLYTGARASEIGQLLTLDVVDDKKGPLFFRLTDEGEGQSLKNAASCRDVPVHPDLLALGFKERRDWLIANDEPRCFPGTKPGAKNGAGNWISKAFSRYLEELSSAWPTGKRGFHSFRKTFIQQLQGKGVSSEMRAQIVGHELDDEHHSKYSREFTISEKLNGVRAKGFKSPGMRVLSFGLELVALRELLTANPLAENSSSSKKR